ncbi:MAG: DUF3368 domain-containing protein [Phycisphaerales bacterium]|nr:DUF3368 domain-containing protein [Phycisphaerales bacterium]
MLVIADSSPIIALVNIGYVEVLPELFQHIAIPPTVADELARPARPEKVREFIRKLPSWLSIRKPSIVESIPNIHAGEREAISLARELHADLLLIDDDDGKKAARARNVAVTGTVGVLERAARQKLLNLEEAFDRLKKTDFWIRAAVLDERLKLYRNEHST